MSSRTRAELAIANQRLAAENQRLRDVLIIYVEGDEFVYGVGHTARSVAGREALRQGSRGPAVSSPTPPITDERGDK